MFVHIFKNWLLLIACMVYASKADYVLQLELENFFNLGHSLANGSCCEDYSRESECTGTCDTVFVFCWKDYNSTSLSNAANTCISRASSRVYTNGDFISFPTGPTSLNPGFPLGNPIEITGDIWPGGLQMFVRVVHIDGVVKPLVDHFRVQELLTPPAQSSFKSYEGLENNADLVARFILTCAENFYQSDCSVYCEPQDSDELGHYDCGENGEKLCHLGYIDPASNCTEWVCPCGMGACFFPAPDSLLCVCPTDYRGDYCQYEAPCDEGLCHNGGTCISIDTSDYICECSDGYGGSDCTDDLDVCGHLSPCQNGGTCTNAAAGANGYHCQCLPGYSGTDCDMPNDPCMGDPCDNGGSCLTNGPAEYVCMCAEGYDGKMCQLDIDVCGHIQPCRHNATCLNTGPNTYECLCQDGFSGRQCELRIATNQGSESNQPGAPLIAGSVVGIVVIVVLFSLILCVAFYIGKRRGRFTQKSGQPANPLSVYINQSSDPEGLTSSQHVPQSNHNYCNTDSGSEVERVLGNPLYSDGGHYYSSADGPQYNSSDHYYTTPDNLNHHYQVLDQNSRHQQIEGEPYYSTINEGGTSHKVSLPTNAPVKSNNDGYSEPSDTRRPSLYHILDSGTGSTNTGSTPGSPPPVYQELEQPAAVGGAPCDGEYDDAKTPDVQPQHNDSTYESIDNYRKPTV